ncbi:hypothetical protein SEA_PICKLEBACK_88 [Mycobacterium phage PickleBack]|uniref:Uncharacterized protein n=1 Tax=Mycobacterium phage Bluefalcon TaxID=2664224 RepID=A0A5Q2WFW8_9CAUD|nr:hypothetical protein KIP51_gp06 [Mycobacterium phage Bluefalcon]QGH75427.1 hypothetical protein SEA_BLUEFALCON_82 [Mycobacterium phage Bluefalcon]WNN94320.1 hypothetical protein SEA_PICKLEBACK_88 [Mycobacterium phage PickleBack]
MPRLSASVGGRETHRALLGLTVNRENVMIRRAWCIDRDDPAIPELWAQSVWRACGGSRT